MEEDFYGLPLKVISEDDIKYRIDPFQATSEALDHLWEEAGKHSFLFSDITKNDRARFNQAVVSPATVILTVSIDNGDAPEPVGVVMADRIIPDWDARVHYFFWDKIQKGRQRLLLVCLRWLIDQFKLRRATAEIMQYAYAGLKRARELGFYLEGRKRNATVWKEKNADVFLFGILNEELTNSAIEKARIHRTPEEASWFGLLEGDNNYALAHAMTKER